MACPSDALWLSVNPSLRHFDQRLCRLLRRHVEIQYWSYHQTPDEPCSIETAVTLLHDYLKHRSVPIHLIGHGVSGAVALLYARLHPSRVKSLTLLGVGANPAISWHTQYYALRNNLPCNRQMILMQMARILFGAIGSKKLTGIARVLVKNLDTELSSHSLIEHRNFESGGVEVPILVCNGAFDTIIDPNEHARWQPYLNSGDRLWTCQKGRHFFHHSHASQVNPIIVDFWQRATSPFARTALIEVIS
ncbi:hypothetical protein Lepto7376_2333 [[Leptolyngbya] sp. PCC 7376]|uniref:alpha/beta fold hydrolase n=1 Tax=[Leptolyngbya] sp. PCC 7376 TaxID=111781 RepID=UPI00029F049C|nr:alpha/beta hydrolase [[Leptolyngbya] sp. PCC 7376]AFY38619.1 hypothetical protein Lepto7376_2333 [[Leptolyngbya] sp. PCC 7376]